MHETIPFGEMNITFIKTRHETAGCLDLYELTIPPHAKVPSPHIHRKYDETVFGLDGVVTWTIDDEEVRLERGDKLFVPRGAPHSYANLGHTTARLLCLHTPGVIGPEFFRELAIHFTPEGAPDLAAISEVVNRYGVIPVTSAKINEPPFRKDQVRRISV